MRTRVLTIAAAAAVLSGVAGYYAGNHLARETDSSIGQRVLKLQVLSTTNKLDAALSTLESLERGDMATARQMLEAEVKPALLILEKLGPELELTGEERQMVNDTVAKGSAYATTHDLR